MYLSTITLKNFRKYAYDGANKHGITVNFHKGLNALIGENDSGKSAIIDAIKLPQEKVVLPYPRSVCLI